MYKIRQATKEDIKILVELRRDLITELKGEMTSEFLAEFNQKMTDYLNENLGDKFLVWIAENENQVIATSGLNIFEKPPAFTNLRGLEAYIMNIYVIKEYRKKGIARDLMEKIINYCDSLEIEEIKLIASKEGRPIYQKLGFSDYDNGMVRKRGKE